MRRPLTASITRPANTTAYAAGDVIGTASSHVITFYGAKDEKGYDLNRAIIARAVLIDNEAPATLPSLELWLFDTAPAAQADNAAFAVTDTELANVIGVIPFTYSYVGLASGNHIQQSDLVSLVLEVKSGASDIYGVLVVRNAYTPVSGETFKILLSVVD